ncbi:unnamed protein product, partial [Mesorhabditis belari]|uniref:Fungal lipase-like domain-containing protein n=1 Tax=Mesorhabditis belari TaxID=2138241 RepID=A0AAF3EMN6_9BILA
MGATIRLILNLILLISIVYGSYFNEYSDRFARKLVIAAAGARADDPMQCLNQAFPQDFYRLISRDETICDAKQNTCACYTAVSTHTQTIIVAFRGTSTQSQMKTEMSESLKPSIDWYGYGLIDKYFYDAIDKLWPYIQPALNETSSSHFEVIFTGYSLGGALATLAAMKTHAMNLRASAKIKLLTFGEPRVGNSIFATNVDRVINDGYRVVHKADIVPHLPPCKDAKTDRRACDRGDLRRMYHHGTEVWYNNDMGENADYHLCTKDDEDPECSDGLKKYEAKDHLNYFGWDVGAYGASNCTSNVRVKAGTRRQSSVAFGLLSLFILLIR